MAEFQKIALWQELEGKINAKNEFRPPVSSDATAPTLGKGAQRANPTTGAPEYWDGTAWKAVEGGDTTNWTPGNSFSS